MSVHSLLKDRQKSGSQARRGGARKTAKTSGDKTIPTEMLDEIGWLSVVSAARYLDMSRSKLYKLIESRVVPHHRIPGSVSIRFRRADLDKWMESGRVQTVQEALAPREKGVES